MSYQPYDRNPSGVIFFGTNSTDQTFESASTLVYDSGNNRFGINNAAPSGSLHVDNLQMNGNTLSTTNNNGNLILKPNGLGNIVGGVNQTTIDASYSVIGGGLDNTASGTYVGILSGSGNFISANYSIITGGTKNCITCSAYESSSNIGGGTCNTISGYGVNSIGGGCRNCILSSYGSTLSGGYKNHIQGGGYNSIGGGGFQYVQAGLNNTISGGENNKICCDGSYFPALSTIAGGGQHKIYGQNSTISGGYGNTVGGGPAILGSTIAGGVYNCTSSTYGVIGGGLQNFINARYSTINGGHRNIIQSPTNECCSRGATIGGGIGHNSSGGTLNSTTGNITGTITCCNAGRFSTIGGGLRNCALEICSTIAGGAFNSIRVNGQNGFIGGGTSNQINGPDSVIGGGNANCTYDTGSAIVGGYNNVACKHSFIGNGYGNTASSCYSVVVAGYCNTASSYCSSILGGAFNSASGDYSAIVGGCRNTTSADYGYSFIGAGLNNIADGYASFVGAGCQNAASGDFSVVVGGNRNLAQAGTSTIGGGSQNQAYGNGGTISGGSSNKVYGCYNAIGGGSANTASEYYSSVGGGYQNRASGDYATVVGGHLNFVDASYASSVGYCNSVAHTNSHIIGSGITSSAADTLYTNKICANNTITGTSIIKSGGTSSQFLKADGSVDSTGYTTCVGTVTSVAAGNGMNFGTITTTGSVALGTPSNVTLSSTNSLTANSHTHAFAPGGDTTEYIRGDGSLATFPTNVASGVGSAGHIAFWTATNSLSYDNNELFWDQTNNRLGVGTGSPSYELDIDGSGRFTGTLNVNGDLIVNGTTTTVNSTVVTIEDPILVLGSGTPTTDDNKDRGIAFNYFDGSAKQGFFGYDDNEQKFTFMTDATIAGEVVSGTVGTIKADLVGDVTGNADTATLATDASGLTSAVTIQLGGQLSGSDTFQDAGDTATITASLTSNAITDQTEITSVDGTNDHILIYDSGVGLRKVTPQNFIDDLNIVTSFNVSDGTTNVTVEQGETLSFADGTGAEFVVTNNAGQPTITVNSVDSEIVHDNLSGFVGNEHINHSSVTLTAGAGLTGGGDITTNRTFNIGQGDGITVNADDVALATTVAGSGLNYAAGVLNIGAGTGMSINSTTVGLANTTVAANSYGSASAVATFTVDAQGRLTAAATTTISITSSQVSNFSTAAETAIFQAANFVDSTTIDFTVTAGASVTAGVKSNSISETYLTASVAGGGLSGGNGSPLSINAGDGLSISTDNLVVNVDNSTIEINSDTLRVKDGGITEAKLSRTVDATFSNNDVINADINLVSGGAGGITVKLPAPATGKMVYVKKIDSAVGAVTVERNGTSDSIDGATQKILYSQYESLSFVSDGTHWYIV